MRGAAKAPPAIREAFYSPSANSWTETGVDLGRPGLITDAGDLDPTGAADPIADMERAVGAVLDRGRVPAILGGDHLVAYPALCAFARRFENLQVLHFDAHPDLYDELDGNRFSHACPFARILEEGAIAGLTQVGIRCANGHQREQAERFGVRMVEMRDLESFDAASEGSPLYISFDLDALDPAFAPGVSHHEPGGLSTRQAVAIVHALRAQIVGFDVVELNPARDPSGISAMASAKIVKELMGKILGG
jgi:agmatinase